MTGRSAGPRALEDAAGIDTDPTANILQVRAKFVDTIAVSFESFLDDLALPPSPRTCEAPLDIQAITPSTPTPRRISAISVA